MRLILLGLLWAMISMNTCKAAFIQMDVGGSSVGGWNLSGSVWVDWDDINWYHTSPYFEMADISQDFVGYFSWTNGTTTYTDTTLEGINREQFLIGRLDGDNADISPRYTTINSLHFSPSALDPDFWIVTIGNGSRASWNAGILPGVDYTAFHASHGLPPTGKWTKASFVDEISRPELLGPVAESPAAVSEPELIILWLIAAGFCGRLLDRRRPQKQSVALEVL
ncbi:hypothetical protein [Alteromonas lipolytica]|uniref:PEP-CTERM protein-sorting domain-containing protein n=1 Tax=Alteromonas lipolytica TaxID=1856405 RepID=A0A1E8FCU0_9ALTE|nr:hypothetical protein [Alteromonas lipolytica]OFI33313.1 hypothetical protein BFC17_03365 [Alteromonas lipolytica]GGF60763.1 hypothetical protein GCM10011338_11290 [Alteromonas lipolytica]